eukprot:TRINITY_DN40269_c0_g1_i2.p1 TRINITY_DN40269_c0_g1~~TRINITY_DN40269_c0_g1_i2.p1  ORF type:complete len:139 (-),score=8.64 TRINITY_DN40269_c0_g1_i2:186-602(-)
MIRRPPRSTLSSSSAASDVYKRQVSTQSTGQEKISIHTYKSVAMKIQNSKTSKALLALAAFATVGLASCSSGEKEKVIEEQTISIKEMQSEIASRDSAFNEVLNMLSQVEGQVATIVEKENLIANAQSGDNALSLIHI